MKSTDTNSSREQFQQKHGIVGSSIEIEEIVNVIQQVAPTDITVLITGESGTGKEVAALAIHAASKRSKKPMVTVNCGAIPEGIIESELFGHEKGSFTGASDTRKGYFELADGGTIFLDEIGELPPSTQVKFLRILENGEFMRVGSPLARKVDVRVIAATNKDLESEVRAKRFRADLFYRLRSVNMRIPPLRERREDIPALFEKFARDYAAANNIVFGGITDEAMDVFLNYYWPGNVRELRNVAESMLVIGNGRKLTAEDVQKYLKGFQVHNEERNLPVFVPKNPDIPERELIYRALVDLKNEITELRSLVLDSINGNGERHGSPVMRSAAGHGHLSLEDMERTMIIESLEKYAGNRRSAAQALKISERTLYRKIKEYGLQ
ncbi:MAG: sigma-54 dependent transcriptional regulator [Ignavibacteriales bacterium]|nr:sigma-54 dependent transcriptional regulator [Ignavibacteriales bacterium]